VGVKMALETLAGVEEIGGFEVGTGPSSPHYILADHDQNLIVFKIQNGPIKDNGVNGCQVDTLIEAAKVIIEGLNKKLPCSQNELAIVGLDIAIKSLKARTKDREARGVEGKNEA
jgi:hypothetical protein